MTRGIGPDLYPVAVDTSDGSVSVRDAKAFLTYDPETFAVAHIAVYSARRELLLDADVTAFREGSAPRMIAGRHQITLVDGRVVYLQMQGGCGCGSRLKTWRPGALPATSGFRP